MQQRYERNFPAIDHEQQEMLARKKVLVLGCGGLGGYLIEYLARLGVGHITGVDGDVFEESNLNRQILSAPALLGVSKAEAAGERVKHISPATGFTPVKAFFDESNAEHLVAGMDLVLDALDNLPARLLMEDVCEKAGVPFVHGAILGWNIQVTTGLPGTRVLHSIYRNASPVKSTDPVQKTSLAMTPPACAALQTAEALKLLIGEEPSLAGKLFFLDLRNMEQFTIPV